ncbi:MAG TPA: hypothetical protein DGR97_03530 [Gammaproteobacteria bacterium]|nr:hypothetical protein [Gammaproteobacteria bacterium]|tara:strand:- start:1414 stop:2316 length:903 start_codon:yes stop_codon:yes gene_type:complete
MAAKTTNIAILFADIGASNNFYQKLGGVTARLKIADCLDTLAGLITRKSGTVIKSINSEIMSTFPTIAEATMAACAMRALLDKDLPEHAAVDQGSLTIRIGMHYGPVIIESGDVFGDAVNIAARMTALAKDGQIVTTQSMVNRMSPFIRSCTRFIDRVPIKGKKETMSIFEILWHQEDVTRGYIGATTRPSIVAAYMRLTYRGVTVLMDTDATRITVGRSKSADLTVDESLASRQHVTIERRRNRFFIIDQSTNGTYVHHGSSELFLRREEMLVSGNGVISLGRPLSENPLKQIHFNLEY